LAARPWATRRTFSKRAAINKYGFAILVSAIYMAAGRSKADSDGEAAGAGNSSGVERSSPAQASPAERKPDAEGCTVA